MSSPIGYPQGDSLKAASSGSAPDNQIGQNLIDQVGGYSPVAGKSNPLTGGIKVGGADVSAIKPGSQAGYIAVAAGESRTVEFGFGRIVVAENVAGGPVTITDSGGAGKIPVGSVGVFEWSASGPVTIDNSQNTAGHLSVIVGGA